MSDASARRDVPPPPALDTPNLAGAKLFVAAVYLVLATAFVASLVLLYDEFANTGWWTLAVAHSHLFLFFPTFGLLALAAFFIPAVIFTHFYWTHVPYGRLRFLFGTFVVLAATIWINGTRLGELTLPRSLWEVKPSTLDVDRPVTVACREQSGGCRREPLLPALAKLRTDAQGGIPLSKFARPCEVHDLLEPPVENTKERWCYPAGRKLTAAPCCDVQKAYGDHLARLVASGATRSRLATWDRVLQPAKAFFVLVIVVIGLMLSFWRAWIEELYPHMQNKLERHILVGGLAMLLWPVMDYAYQDTANALFGRADSGPQLRLSLIIGPWALVLLFYFLRRFARKVEVVGQIVGVAGGLFAILVRDELRDVARFFGIGASPWIFAGLAVLLAAGFAVLFWPERWMPKIEPRADDRR